MKHSLLFIPDISGFTQFIQSTEVAHSQHVIAELLEVLIDSNISELELAEIEGDALFFYKEEEILSQEKLIAQIEHTFSAFFSHLKLLETNRICQCKACSTAPELELKIVIHSGQLQFIEVRGNRKPFGQQVIEAHRMMKNSIQSDNYIMISRSMADLIGLTGDYQNELFQFREGQEEYDGRKLDYIYSVIDSSKLKLKPVQETIHMTFEKHPDLSFLREMPVSAEELFEVLSNYRYRSEWSPGVDRFEFNENEVTRKGSEHVCVIDGSRLNFVAVSADAGPGQLVYGEMTTSPPPVDELIQMSYIEPLGDDTSRLTFDVHIKAKSIFKQLIVALVMRRILKRNITKSLNALEAFLLKKSSSASHAS